jgi:hypothetical protein
MMNKNRLIALVMALGLMTGVQAKEGGDQYPNGAEDFMAGALPPPGTYLVNYAGYFSGALYNGGGDKVGGVHVNAWFDAPRLIHVTNLKLFGGDYAFAGLVPVVNQNITTPFGGNSVTGIGDIFLTPVALGWHWPEFHLIGALDVVLPTGLYDKNRPLRSIGANYWTFEPILAFTYLNQQGWELSAKLMYSIRTENSSTDYRSGNEFHMDYTFGKHIGNWALGIGGYYVKQVENDQWHGVNLPGTAGQVLAVGPQVKYDYNNMSFIAKWQHDTLVEGRFGGDKFWFKFVYAF